MYFLISTGACTWCGYMSDPQFNIHYYWPWKKWWWEYVCMYISWNEGNC